MKLFDVTNQIEDLLEAYSTCDPEEEATLKQMIYDLEEARDIKINNTVNYIKNLELLYEAHETTIEKLSSGRKTIGNKIESIKKFLSYFIEPGSKWTFGINSIGWRKSKRLDIDPRNVPIDYMINTISVDIDDVRIKKELAEGKHLSFARFEERQNIQIK